MKYFLDKSRYAFLAVLVGLSSLLLPLSSVLTSTVNAASIYDDLIVQAPDPTIKRVSYYDTPNCANPNTFDSVDSTIFTLRNYISSYTGTTPQSTLIDQFENATSTNKSWSIIKSTEYESSSTSNTDRRERIDITWSASEDLQYIFTGEGFSREVPNLSTPGRKYMSIRYSSDDCTFTLTESYSVAQMGSLQKPTYSVSGQFNYVLVNNLDIDYPDDYEGDRPSDNSPLIYVQPNFTYNVNSNVFTATHTGDGCIRGVIDPSVCSIPKISWGVQLDDGDWTYTTTLVGETFNYVATEYGHYNFSALYVDSGVPYAPLPTEYEYRTTVIQAYIDGFNNYNADTSMCSVSPDGYKVCEEVSPYEDCMEYGIDLIGGIGCQLRNLTVAWQSMLTRLFVPIPTFFNSYYDQFGTYLNNKLGFIYSSIAAVFGILGGVVTGAATTSCTLTPPGTIFGAPVVFNVCQFQSVIGNTPFVAIQTLIIGITVVTLVFAGIRKYQEVVSQR